MGFDGKELPGVARRAIGAWLTEGRAPFVSDPRAPSAPVFVTLRRPDGSLRGCIGTLFAVEADVVAETARNAVAAATRDPRFSPVAPEEMADLQVEVSVLLPEEPVARVNELDPSRFGVIVRDEVGRQGVLLPEVPGVETPEVQVEIARQKAEIPAGVRVRLSRFAVEKFT